MADGVIKIVVEDSGTLSPTTAAGGGAGGGGGVAPPSLGSYGPVGQMLMSTLGRMIPGGQRVLHGLLDMLGLGPTVRSALAGGGAPPPPVPPAGPGAPGTPPSPAGGAGGGAAGLGAGATLTSLGMAAGATAAVVLGMKVAADEASSAIRQLGGAAASMVRNEFWGMFAAGMDKFTSVMTVVSPIVGATSKVFMAVAEAGKALVDSFLKEASRLQQFSPEISVARGFAEFREVLMSLREAQTLGPLMGRMVDLESQIDVTLREALLPIKYEMAKFATELLGYVLEFSQWLNENRDILKLIYEVLASFGKAAGWTMDNFKRLFPLFFAFFKDADKKKNEAADNVLFNLFLGAINRPAPDGGAPLPGGGGAGFPLPLGGGVL